MTRALTLLTCTSLLLACSGPQRVDDGGGLSCGTGTREEGGKCVAVATGGNTCGRGTVEASGQCLGTTVCGAGTSLVGDECRATSAACGAGTTWGGSQCVGTGGGQDACGAGTTWNGSQCVASGGGSVSCGAGTQLSGSSCVPAAGACGANTTWDGSQCVGSGGTQVTCGAGTVLQGAQCVPAGTASTTVSQFVTDPSHLAMLDGKATNNFTSFNKDFDFVYTDASELQSRAFLDSSAAVVGDASMLFIATSSYVTTSTLAANATLSMSIISRGSCNGSAFDDYPTGDNHAYVTFGKWAGGTVGTAVCATAGSVVFEEIASPHQVKITLNAVFSDGTTISNRVWTLPYNP